MVDTRAIFHVPSRHGAEVTIETRITRFGRSSFDVEHPLMRGDVLAMETMYDGELGKDFKGVVALFQHVHGGQAIHMADTLVRSPADLAGMKIRIPSRTGAWVVEALGASPVKTSVGEIPTALAKKVVDGALLPFEIIPPLKIHEQTRYQIEGPGGKRLGTTSFSVVINEDRWNGLPDDVRKIFEDASGSE